jgi:hypothetical protein
MERALAMVSTLISLRCIALGNLVEVHMAVTKYWFPTPVLGKDTKQSTNARLNVSSKAGMG